MHFSWEKLMHAVALLERIGRDGSIDRLFKLRPDTHHVSEYVGNISALPAYRLVQNVKSLYRQLSPEERDEQHTLEQLVCFLVIFECSDPRDIIYAVLGIASDVKPSYSENHNDQTGNDPTKFPVLYGNEEPLVVYMRFVERAIKRYRSLDILCRPWAPALTGTKLPSWMLDATQKPFRPTSRGKMVRYNPDPFVGPAVKRKFYTASGEFTNSSAPNLPSVDFGNKEIIVEAFKLARPTDIWDLAVHGSIPASWLRGVNWNDSTTPPPEEFWRTLVADRTSAGSGPEPDYSSIIQAAVLEKGVQYGINTNEFIHEKDNSAYYEVFRRVQAVVWNRKLIRAGLCDTPRTTSEGRPSETPLGLVPAKAEKDDFICIVNGCSVPLVLRHRRKRRKGPAGADGPRKGLQGKDEQQNRLPAGDEDTYELIGECYINNMMEGRAMDRHVGWDVIKIA